MNHTANNPPGTTAFPLPRGRGLGVGCVRKESRSGFSALVRTSGSGSGPSCTGGTVPLDLSAGEVVA